jgi:hypothetical protein
MTKHREYIKHIFPRIVSTDCRNHFVKNYPIFWEKTTPPKFLKLFEYLLFGTYTDEYTKELIISRKRCAEIELKLDDLFNDKYVAKKFLDDMVKYLPKFRYSDSYGNGFARTIIDRGITDEDINVLLEEGKKSLDQNIEKCYFMSGKIRGRRDKVADRKKLLELKEVNVELIDDQKMIIHYMNNIPINTFSGLYNRNIKETIFLLDKLNISKNAKIANISTLSAMEQNPKPLYGVSADSKTLRVHHKNQCFLGLKRDLRKEFLKGTYEADLRNSRFRIAASLLNAPLALQFIDDEKDLWKEISIFVKGDENYSDNEKAEMKSAMYAIIYGMSKKGYYDKEGKYNIGILDILKPIGFEKMLEMPMIEEIMILRNRELTKIKKDGYIIDAYDRKIQIKSRKRASLFSEKIQSIEFQMIAQIFKLPLEKIGIKIVCFLHDGFSFILDKTKSLERLEEIFNDAIKETADKWNVKSRFKVEYNG